MARVLSGGLALFLALNALAMLAAPLNWYDAVPGVTATGAYNPHFVRDIGAAYLATALGLAWHAWRPREGRPALTAAAVFLLVHAAIHVFDAACGPRLAADVARDFPGVYAPALIAAVLTALNPRKENAHAEVPAQSRHRPVRTDVAL